MNENKDVPDDYAPKSPTQLPPVTMSEEEKKELVTMTISEAPYPIFIH